MSKYIAIYLMLLCPAIVFAQELHTTSSGQKILHTVENEWKVVPDNAALDENGQLITTPETSISVFEDPMVDNSPVLTLEQQQIITQTRERLKTNERNLYIEMKKLEQKIDQIEALDAKDGILIDEKTVYKNTLNDTRYKYKNVGRILDDLNDIKSYSPSKIQDKLDALVVAADNSLELPDQQINQIEEEEEKQINTYPEIKDIPRKKDKEKVITGYTCEVTFNGKDPETKKRKKIIKESELFTYTHPKLKPHFKKDNFMTCQSKLSRIDRDYFITLNFRIKSKSAKKSYGKLKANDRLQIEFIDGSKVFGENTATDKGVIEPYSGHTLYTGVYKIKKEDLRQISKKLVDKIGIVWSTGYEKYDIYNVDLLLHQLNCLRSR